MSYQRPAYYSSRRQQNWSRNQNTARFVSTVKLGPVAHTVLVALMITVLGLIYLTQATKVTGYDHQASQIDAQIAELSTKKSDLEVENARLTALDTIQKSSVASQMTQPGSTGYVR